MENQNSQLPTIQQVGNRHVSVSPFVDSATFEAMKPMAMMLANSSLVPAAYQGTANAGNCMLALEMAQRIGASPFMVMQNLHIIKGKPSFSSKFLIATANTCGRFSPIQYRFRELGDKKAKYSIYVEKGQPKKYGEQPIFDIECIAFATDLKTGKELEGPPVTVEMAVAEGWYTKTDSKWPTMTKLMLTYRAASFFVNTYAPEISMGMATAEEIQDIDYVDITPVKSKSSAAASLGKSTAPAANTGDAIVAGDADGEPAHEVEREDFNDNADVNNEGDEDTDFI